MEKLFTDFNASDAAAWKARLEKDLKGVTFEQLSVTDRNGICIHPFYTEADLKGEKAALNLPADWNICTSIKVSSDINTAHAQALTALNNGVSGLCFTVEQDADPERLLQDIELPYIYTDFRLKANTLPFAGKLRAYLAQKGWDAASMNCFTGYDFIGAYMTNGSWNHSREEDSKAFLSLTHASPGALHLNIDATLFQNAGAHSTYELACALAQVNEYLHLLDQAGRTGDVQKIQISITTDTSFFEQIAKLRAFRKLLPLVLDVYRISPGIHLHVETAHIFRSPFDSYSNLLRDTIAGMAAVIGGCNSLYIHPFNETLGEPTDFSRRMSRNQQLIFKEESYLDKVADAAAGSYYLETLTEQIGEQAWILFKEIETDGGLLHSFEKGIIRNKINAQAQQLVQEYKEGKRVLIGVNKFVNAKDEPKPAGIKDPQDKGLKPLLLSAEIIE